MYASIAAQRRRGPGVLVRAARLPDRPVGPVEVGAPAVRREPPRAVLQPVRLRHRRRQRSVDGHPQLPEWAQQRSGTGTRAPPRRGGSIAHGKLSMGDPDFESLILSDPPRHGQIRNILMKALRPSLVRSLKPRIAEITDEFLDEIEPGAETDFVTTVGRIPAALMTELIGVPRDMRDRFIEMASAQMRRDHHRSQPGPRPRSTRVQRARRGVPRLLRRRCWPSGAPSGDRRRRPREHHRPVGARRWTGAPRHGDLVHPHLRQRGRDEPGAPVVRGPGAGRAPRPAAPPRRAAGADRRTRSRRRCATTRSTGPAAAPPRRTSRSAGSSSAKATT